MKLYQIRKAYKTTDVTAPICTASQQATSENDWWDDTDLSKGYGQARKRGLSRQKLCICVAIDVHKNPVAVVCGRGKPSSARVRKAMGGRIAPGSLLIHDIERAHGALCRSTRTARGSSSRSSPTPTRGSRW